MYLCTCRRQAACQEWFACTLSVLSLRQGGGAALSSSGWGRKACVAKLQGSTGQWHAEVTQHSYAMLYWQSWRDDMVSCSLTQGCRHVHRLPPQPVLCTCAGGDEAAQATAPALLQVSHDLAWHRNLILKAATFACRP